MHAFIRGKPMLAATGVVRCVDLPVFLSASICCGLWPAAFLPVSEMPWN
jgi:hypothetical protein